MVHHVGENTFSYLQSVMGQEINYHEGPKEQTGKLLAINPEYMVLLAVDGAVEYWNLLHIKRVKFPSKIHPKPAETRAALAASVYHADSFPDLMMKLKNSYVTVDRGKKHSKSGWVVDANPDFFVLLTKEMGPIYYTHHHIRNIVHHVRNIALVQNEEEKEENMIRVQPAWEMAPFVVKTAKTLEGLMGVLKYTWVQINEGPDKLGGMVAECSGGHVTLVSHENVYRLPCHHIRQISLGFTSVDDTEQTAEDHTEQTTDANSTPNMTLSRYTLLIQDTVSHTPRRR